MPSTQLLAGGIPIGRQTTPPTTNALRTNSRGSTTSSHTLHSIPEDELTPPQHSSSSTTTQRTPSIVASLRRDSLASELRAIEHEAHERKRVSAGQTQVVQRHGEIKKKWFKDHYSPSFLQ